MDPYRVRTASRRVERQLEAAARAHRPSYERIRAAILALASAPRPPGCARLRDEETLYRIRIGDWRVLYHVDDAGRQVVIAKVARRSEQTYR